MWISGHFIGALLCTKASDIVQKREEASRKCEYASESETCIRSSKRDKAKNILAKVCRSELKVCINAEK